MKKRHYSVDLAGLLADCEANYARLCRLLPNIKSENTWHFGVNDGELSVSALDQAPYTTTLELCQLSTTPGLPDQKMQVRVCHDATVAEVIAYQGQRRIRPKYDYPHAEMRHRDEQKQLNRFLGEWLSYCLLNGRNLNYHKDCINFKQSEQV
jgi:uncharacterized protein YqiB (DUF1249 family)